MPYFSKTFKKLFMIRYPAALLLCLLFAVANSQSIVLKTIAPHELPITHTQTTSIIFPYAIQSVDRGSNDVLAQPWKGAKNILLLKAAQKNMSSTNVTVVTTDGQFYCFLLHYDEHPLVTSVQVERDTGLCLKAQLANQPVTADSLEAIGERLNRQPAKMLFSTNRDFVQLWLRNIAVDSLSMWFTFRLSNYSAIGFTPDICRFYIKERHQAKRTAVQEKPLAPLYMNTLRTIGYSSPLTFTAAFPPFTIKRSQRFYVQLAERSGARILILPIRYKRLLKARPLR
jgi:conjugative transposon TraN protein